MFIKINMYGSNILLSSLYCHINKYSVGLYPVMREDHIILMLLDYEY